MLQQFPNKVTLHCPLHRNNNCTHICMDSQCTTNPYLCPLCIQDANQPHASHEYNVSSIDDGVNHITRSLHNYKAEFEKTLSNSSKTYQQSELQNLVTKLSSSVQELKRKIEGAVEKLVVEFRVTIENVRDGLFQELEKYQKVRIGIVETYKDSISHFKMYNKLKFYANSSTLLLKLKTEHNKKSTDWVQDIKKYINKSEDILIEHPNFMSSLSQSIDEIMVEQVGYVEEDVTKQMRKSLEEAAAMSLKQMVFIRSKVESLVRKKYKTL